MSNLVSRTLVAVLLAPIALGAMWAGGPWLVLLGLVASVLAVHELFTMARAHRPMALAGQAGAGAMIVGAHWGGVAWAFLPLPVTLLVAFLMAAGVAMRESATVSVAVTMLAPIWIGGGLASLVLLRDAGSGDRGFTALLAVTLGTWACDIAAYFGGRAVGRRKLAPAISPGKTVEGFFFGLAIGTLVTWWVLYGQKIVSPPQAVVVGVAVALVGPFGDLFESFLKRDLGVKDSGSILGGHGGVLDRIDAMLLSGPAALIAFDLLARW